MSQFDVFTDAPGQLRSESLSIKLQFDRTSPSSGRISWNIPPPAAGCAAGTQAFCGIILTVDSTAASSFKVPTHGTVYQSDPTADRNLFAGDSIGTSLVVGAFYQDKKTTFVDITGLTPNAPYYISGFPTDCQNRYFVEGVHAYSLDYTLKGSDDTFGSQVVVFNPNGTEMGIDQSDSTGLDSLSNYTFDVTVGLVPRPKRPLDSIECTPVAPTYTINVAGSTAATFGDLIAELRKQIMLLDQPFVGPTPPGNGTYYWNSITKSLALWNGHQLIPTIALVQSTNPTVVSTGQYWSNATQLQVWNGTSWLIVPTIESITDPSIPRSDLSYWFDGTTVYKWNGNVWCDTTQYVSPINPSLPIEITPGSHWYDGTNAPLKRWNDDLEVWSSVLTIQSSQDPTNFSQGYLWLNLQLGTLQQWNLPLSGWNLISNFYIGEATPTAPAPGKFWYKPSTQTLYERNSTNTGWIDQDYVEFPMDPTNRTSCEVWWDVSNDTLYNWSIISNTWTPIVTFYQSPKDPATPPILNDGDVWFNPSSQILYVWGNNCFKPAHVILTPTDSTTNIVLGTGWKNGPQWKVWSPLGWTIITSIESVNDPRALPIGTWWFDLSVNALNMWNGIAWISVAFTTTPPTHLNGTLWYNSTSNVLYTWTNQQWQSAVPRITVEIDCNGNFIFTDTSPGSTSFIKLKDGNLFSSLSTPYKFHDPKPGTDGISDQPSYEQMGVGTDGNDAIRKSIANDIRTSLGYPVVNVELTPEQIDYAISLAISTLRQRSGMAYRRGFFFMPLQKNQQKFILSNTISGMNKIVDIMGVYRTTASFLSAAHGSGLYGQITMQHMYNMGSFDLLSFHIVSEYSKLMEMLFAARLTFTWNEQQRELFIHNKFPQTEKMVCIEATVERTEQEILSDRYIQPWIRKFAGGQCKLILAETRGKFSTLPGAGGSVTLNANDLRMSGKEELESAMQDIEDYVVERPEEFGIGQAISWG